MSISIFCFAGASAQIVGAGLESESYYRHAHAPEIREESARFINKLYTLFAVDIDSRFYCLELHSGVVALKIGAFVSFGKQLPP